MNIANCVAFDMPVTGFDNCNPVVNFSEIERIFVGSPQGADFTDIEAAAEWISRLSQTATGPNAIRALIVIGDMPAPAPVTRDLSNGRRKTVGKDYTVNYTVDDVSQANYDFFKMLDENPLIKLYGWETQGGQLFHFGNSGKVVNHTSSNVLARGRDEIEVENGSITWRAGVRPSRIASPIFEGEAGGGGNAPTTFEVNIDFGSSATPAAVGQVGFTAPAVDAEQQFEFDPMDTPSGTPASMTITVGGVEELVVDFPSGYAGQYFRYTDKAGAPHTSTFINGTRAF